MVTQAIDGISFPMARETDFSFLGRYGRVFQVFAHNDSGNISFGVERDGEKLFIKVAGAPTAESCLSPAQAVENLRAAAPLYRELAHPALIRLEGTFTQGPLYGAMFQWAPGECLFDHWNFERYAAQGIQPPRERFRALPVERKLAAFQAAFDFLRAVEARGFVAVDFYDGSLLYDFPTGRTTICDIDLFRRRPAFNELGADFPGTKRVKAPEEYQRGAPLDSATNVFTLGALLFHFFGHYSQEDLGRMYAENAFFPCGPQAWELGAPAYAAARRAVSPQREERFPTVEAFSRAWEAALAQR